jgi:SAM-dependent methyltransferase
MSDVTRTGNQAQPLGLLSLDAAILRLRSDTAQADLVRDSYLDRDVRSSAERFAASAEWQQVKRLLDGRVDGATVVDLGAGTGIASAAFAVAGARRVIAVEPDPSDEVGRGAMSRLGLGPEVEVIGGVGEQLPLKDGVADVVYCRQVLHHASDLESMVAEMARVLKDGGVLLACREHVVDDDRQLQEFLGSHPVHRLAGGENAFSLDRYQAAISASGLTLTETFGPWESVINAFPLARTREDLDVLPSLAMRKRFGTLGAAVAWVPAVSWLVWRRLRQPLPGRMYTFVATKAEHG